MHSASCKRIQYFLHTLAVGVDHVRGFASLPFDMSPVEAEGKLEGRSAYLIFREIPNFRLRYPNGHFWVCPDKHV